MNEADRIIEYREKLIENIKLELEQALQQTNNIELGDKEFSIFIYCNNSDRLLAIAKNDKALHEIIDNSRTVENDGEQQDRINKAIDYIEKNKREVNSKQAEDTNLKIGTFMWGIDKLLNILKGVEND